MKYTHRQTHTPTQTHTSTDVPSSSLTDSNVCYRTNANSPEQKHLSFAKLFKSIKQIQKEYSDTYTLQECYHLILFSYLSSLVSRERGEKQCFTDYHQLQQRFLLQYFSIPDSIPTAQLIEQIDREIIPQCTITRLGHLYECIFHGQGNLSGVYYTPELFASEMLDEIVPLLPHTPQCLDPSCGTGVFLLLMLEKLSRSTSEAVEDILPFLYGVDSDPGAVALCRLFLVLSSTDSFSEDRISHFMSIVQKTIQCADTLERHGSALHNALSLEHFPEGGFDLLVGNPPYGLSREDRIDPKTLARYKEQYSDIRSGKLNKYMMFIARAHDLIAEEGILHFVVPNSWLGIRSAQKLRTLLLSTFPLTALTLYPKGALGDPSLEPIVLTVRNNTSSKTIAIHNRLLDPQHPYANVRIPRTSCLNRPECIIPLYWDSPVAALLHHLRESCSTLSTRDTQFLPRIALQAYAQGKGSPPQSKEIVKQHAFHSMSPMDEHSIPYLQGKDIHRYQLVWSGSYLRYGPWLAEPQSIDRFSGPRILMREILGSFPHVLQACYTDDCYLYNKSVLHILPGEEGNAETMLALLSVLNAPLGSMQWLLLGRKSQRLLFPKIVNSDVRDFLVPNSWQNYVQDLACLSKQALTSPQNSYNVELEQLTREAYSIKGTVGKSYDRVYAALSSL